MARPTLPLFSLSTGHVEVHRRTLLTHRGRHFEGKSAALDRCIPAHDQEAVALARDFVAWTVLRIDGIWYSTHRTEQRFERLLPCV